MTGHIRHESMRIAGRKVETEGRIEVHYPYTNEVIGTVPRGTAEHAREAFQIAADYKSTLSRYERQQILFRVAEILESRKDEISDLITPHRHRKLTPGQETGLFTRHRRQIRLSQNIH